MADNNRRPVSQQSRGGLTVPDPAPAESSRRTSSRLSASSRPLSGQPPTPSARSDNGDDYFDTFPDLASQYSRSSFMTSDTSHPGLTRTRSREPSIQVRLGPEPSRRGSNRRGSVTSTQPQDSSRSRPRSISEPDRAGVLRDIANMPPSSRRSRQPPAALPRLTEEGNRPTLAELGVHAQSFNGRDGHAPAVVDGADDETEPENEEPTGRRRALSRLIPGFNRRRASTAVPEQPTYEDHRHSALDERLYESELVDILDPVDPEVQTLATLTNVQNSLFVPDLGPWLNRRPTYTISRSTLDPRLARLRRGSQEVQPAPPEQPSDTLDEVPEGDDSDFPPSPRPSPPHRSNTITSRLTDSHYAALPHGRTLEGWTEEEKLELDDHVRHMLHSRRSRFKRSLKGFGQYVRRPLGFFVTLYATLITLFGLAWVLFLIGWIEVGSKQSYTIHIIDSVLVALFAIMGDGLAPFRAVDTYHLFFVVRYSNRLKRWQQGKPPRSKLKKSTDAMPEDVRWSLDAAQMTAAVSKPEPAILPGENGTELDGVTRPTTISASGDLGLGLEEGKGDPRHYPLTEKQQKSLQHHINKLAKSHSFYKPEETFTHNPFPLAYLIAIVVLLDCHSCLQISLGACTWGIDYHHRPFALTTVILCVSITCNISAGLVITRGDHITRKKDVIKLLDRQELTKDAIKHVEKHRRKAEEKGRKGETMQSSSESTIVKPTQAQTEKEMELSSTNNSD